MRRSFYDHPDLYDLLFAPEPPVVDFYAACASRAAGPVLELACGTGRILVPVAQRGVPATGLDVSPAMLARARAYADAAGTKVELVAADMCSFQLQQRFALVLLPSNSLSHLADLASLRRFFDAAKRHLAADGRLVFDVANPDVRALARLEDERRAHGRIVDPEWGALDVEERHEYDAATQITTSLWHLRSPEQRGVETFALRLRNFFPCELELLVQASGFSLLERYGDFNGMPFTSDSPHQVCVCRAQATPG